MLAQKAIQRLLAKAVAEAKSDSRGNHAAIGRELEQLIHWIDGQKCSAQLRKEIRQYVAERLTAIGDGTAVEHRRCWTG